MKNFYLVSIILLSLFSSGQNLVINGGFEQYTTCPTSVGQMSYATSWSTPSGGSPDYFNTCFGGSGLIGIPNNAWGYQFAKTGNAYAGLNLIYYSIPNFREYVQGTFSSPLVANNTYLFQMFLNKANFSQNSTDDFQVYFSSTKVSGISGTGPLSFTPQISNTNGNYISDTTNWVLFSAPYTASGGELFFMIGNFKDDAQTTTNNTNSSGSQTNGYIYIDDVTVSTITGINSFDKNSIVNLFPNPFNDKLLLRNPENDLIQISIYDLSKRLLFEKVCNSEEVINTEGFSSGIYIYELGSDNRLIKQGKITKH